MSDDTSLTDPDLELVAVDVDVADAFDADFEDDLEADDDPLKDDTNEVEDIEEADKPDRAPNRAAAGDGEEEDEVDPDNLEDDLNTILRDRIAASDDADDEDDSSEVDTGQPAEMLGTVTPRRNDEWLCEGCFLLVSRSQLGSRKNPRCPSGEEVCPSLDRLGP